MHTTIGSTGYTYNDDDFLCTNIIKDRAQWHEKFDEYKVDYHNFIGSSMERIIIC